MSRLGYYILCGLLCSSAWVVYGDTDNGNGSELPTSIEKFTTNKDGTGALRPAPSFTPTMDSMKDSKKAKMLIRTGEDNLSAEKTTDEPATTTPVPKPTPPGPLPPPDQGTWWYSDDQNITCIVIQFAAQLNVTYTKSVENKTSLAVTLLNVPLNATANGSCAAKDGRQWITLQWPVAENVTNKMAFVFVRNETTKNYMIESLNVSLAAAQFVNASSNATIKVFHPSLWMTPVATSYRCAVATRLNMTAAGGSSVQAAVLTVSRLQEEAFRTKAGKGFSAARECGGGDVPDAVPIAVGCALGGLVVVVLIAYLVARRRSAARGYLSM